jgi:hypothetical protein
MFKPEPGRRYDMPVVFGPSEIGGRTSFAETRTLTHTFLTDPGALEPLVPYHFTLSEPARVVIASSMILGVDWLAGRNYHNVRVSVHVTARHGDALVTGPFHLVDWESDPRPVIAGREYLGIPKIVGEIPEHERGADRAAFECYEYGTRLLRVEITGLAPASEEALARQNSGGDTITLGWKYIPGPGGTVDADYPTMMVSRGKTDLMWLGNGCVVFDQPTWEQCPLSSRIMKKLGELPVIDVRPATLTVRKGGILDRDGSARLDAASVGPAK